MIYTIKKFFDVASPNVSTRIRLQKALRTLYCTEQAFTLPTRPRIMNEGFIPDGHKMIVKQSMNNTVSDGSYRNFSALVVRDNKFTVTTVNISSIIQGAIQLEKVLFKVILKFVKIICELFAFTVSPPSLPNIF